MRPLPSTETLRRDFNYDPETGALTHARQKRGRGRVGETAVSINKKGYAVVSVNSVRYYAHRVIWKIMTGGDPASEVDHRAGDRADNRWARLREATSAANSQNAAKPSTNTSGFKGVSRDKKTGRWAARAHIGGKYKALGRAATPEAAHAIYLAATKPVHGEYHVTERP